MRQNPQKDGPGERVERLEGTIERFTYRDADSGFAVVRFVPDGGGRPVPIVGPLAQLTEGQRVTITGMRREHPRFGPQIEVEAAEASAPTSVDGIRAYLSSSLVKGVGPAMAERITDAFGAEALRVIEDQPERLAEVKGLGPKRRQELVEAVRSQHDVHAVMVFLRAHGLGQNLAVRIVKQLGRNASALIEANPYWLADSVIGIGFRRADQLAGRIGIAPDAPQRIRAGIEHVLGEAAREGHCFLPRDELRTRGCELLACAPALVDAALAALEGEGRVVIEGDSCYPLALHRAEVGVALRVADLASDTNPPLPLDAERALRWFADKSGMQLPDGQVRALRAALTKPFSVITGGPGVGKTTIVRALVEVLTARRLRLVLAAPTGRAAKRLEESTGHGASTLHRLLDFQPGTGRFQRDERNPIEADLVVVDEASMLDVQLAFDLLRALRPPTRVVLVGDIDQLPSVGPGRVLGDLIDSGRVPVTRLTEIFRQHEGSLIVESAHRILRGEEPELGRDGGDFFFVPARDSVHARALLREIVVQRIPRSFGLDPIRDVQVLCPMYRGEVGADAINADLQKLLNPTSRERLERGAFALQRGDKVLQTKNDYELEVFNGDSGRVASIDRESGGVRIDFGDRVVEYTTGDLDQLVLAYAISVHRSQGSEYPAVVLPLTGDHYMMLRRNLLYTAITRGKRLVIVVGTRKALQMAVRNDREATRCSGLAARLRA